MMFAPDHAVLTSLLFIASVIVLFSPDDWQPRFGPPHLALAWPDMPSGVRGRAVPASTAADFKSAPRPTARHPSGVAAEHITRLRAMVTGTIETALTAERLHHTAHQQVDAAHYALQNLYAELAGVMPTAAASTFAQSGPARSPRRAERPVAVLLAA